MPVRAEHPLTAAILCGGRGRRLGGADKSALQVGGQTFLERQLAALEPLASTIFLVGGHPSAQQGPHVHRLADRHPDAGPLGGLCTAIEASATDRIIVLACDMPFVTTALLERLLTAADGEHVVLPRDAEGRHVLCGVFHRTAAPMLNACLERGARRIDHALAQLPVRWVATEDLRPLDPDGRLLLNVNTPEDYDEAARAHARGSACA